MKPALLFYDGGCGLCHRAVRFALKRDPDGTRFRFAPLGGPTFLREIPEDARRALPDSLVLLDAEGLFVRSEATLRVLEALDAPWPILARAARVVPAGLRDRVYDLVARWRTRLFAAPEGPCPLVPAELEKRFLP